MRLATPGSERSRNGSSTPSNAGPSPPRIVVSKYIVIYHRPLSVSLLTDFEDGESYLDWTIGVHGFQITFPHPSLLSPPSSSAPSPLSSSSHLPRLTAKQRSFSATYLPEVIPDQGWTKIEAIDSAIHKAGWTGQITEDIRRSVKLRRYQTRKCVVTWDEFVQWRNKQTGVVDEQQQPSAD